MSRVVKINNCKIEIPQSHLELQKKKKWKGKDVFDVRYWVTGVFGKRRSGKTTLIYTLLKKFCTKNTIVLFFVQTFNKDVSYDSIREFLDSNGINYMSFGNIVEDGVDNIETFLEANDKGEEDKEEAKGDNGVKQTKFSYVCFDPTEISEKPTGKKGKKPVEVEYIIIFDDMSNELRHKSVSRLLKNSRHFKSKIIISSQSISDIHPHSWAQMDYICLFKNYNDESIEFLYKKIEPNLSFEQFLNLYHNITKGKTGILNNFLLVDRANEEYRINLDKKIAY